MKWNWQQKDWPLFDYPATLLANCEAEFLQESGFLHGVYQHIQADNKETLIVDVLSEEALKTSQIEGEYLNRDSLRSSVRRCLGLSNDKRKSSPAEQGIAEMTVDLYQSFAQPLTEEMLCNWHLKLTNSRFDLHCVGAYRNHEEEMQVVSGYLDNLKIHFEAPPSQAVPNEMKRFIEWFNDTAPNGNKPLPALTRASIAHLYFVCIHPFEDGNGRIGRALVEKVLAQSLQRPSLISLSHIIEENKKAYYDALEKANKNNEITEWLQYFTQTILAAQNYTLKAIQFLIQKTKLYDKARGQLNSRQEKVLARIFREGVEGFKGGLSAENYLSITHTSRATATRDLQSLVNKGILIRIGERKSTRYYLNLN